MTVKPNYNVSTTDNGATISIDLPGVKKEDIKLISERDSLKITAPRSQEVPESWQLINQSTKPENYELELNLHTDLNGADSEACFENAVLTLKVSKHEAVKPREISILN